VSRLATAALVFGILGICGSWASYGLPSILAICFGIAGLRATDASRGGRRVGRHQAGWGLALGFLVLIPLIFILLAGGIGAMQNGGPAVP
jgi:hypothetical protein